MARNPWLVNSDSGGVTSHRKTPCVEDHASLRSAEVERLTATARPTRMVNRATRSHLGSGYRA